MSSTKTLNKPPSNMATPIVHLSEVAELLAEKFNVADGDYDVVLEYKIGGIFLAEDDVKYAGLGIGIAGVALRQTVKRNPQTVSIRRTDALEEPSSKNQLKPMSKQRARKVPPPER